MSDEPTPESSPNPSAKGGGPDVRSADPPPEQVEKAPAKKRWRLGWKTRANRIFPPRQPEPEDRLTSPLPGIVLFLVLLGVAALSILLLRPPAPLPTSAPADQYSAARALTHIQALAQRPRPVGTQAHAEAQAYLVAQLKRLGLETHVQEAVAVRYQAAARVENVLARLPGSRGEGKAVLLMAHYDSMPAGPGAGDDVSGVATLLETARALKAGGQPLANDVIFMFSDAEEQGSMGAAAFVEEHPWAKDVGAVLNFDGAGQTGPNMASDISPDNDWLIGQFAQAAPDPLASSLFPDVRRLLRETDDNDFSTILERSGYPGFVIGSAGSTAYYHTVLDDPAHVHLDSLQHQGSYALSLVRRFGRLDLTAVHRGIAVYFNVLGDHLLVHYPQGWAFPLVALAALVWIGALVFGLRWKQVSWRGVLLGALASVLVVAVLAGVGYLSWRLVLAVYPQYRTGGYAFNGNTYNGLYYWLAFLALGVALAALLHIGLRTRIRTAELAMGGLLLWLALAVGSSVWLRGASWGFTWPLLFSSIGLCGWCVLRRHRLAAPWGIVWLALFAIPAVAVVASLLYLGYEGLHIQLVWVAMAILALLAGLLAPHLAIVARPRKWWLPVLMGIVAVGFLVAGHLTSAYTPERPLQDGVVYALSADNGKASWLGWTGLDVWTEQFFAEDNSGGEYRDIFPDALPAAFKAPAPLADLPAPTVEELDVTASGAFHLRVVPPPGAWTVHLIAMPYRTGVNYYVDDRRVEAKDGWLLYWAPPAEGFDVTVKAPALDSLTLRVVAHTLGLPAIPDFTYAARPAWIIPSAESGDNSTWVAKTFSFEKE